MKGTHLILPSARVSSLARLNRLLKTKAYAHATYFIFVDENSYNYCLSEVVARVEALQEAEFVELPIGEECKSIEIAAQVWQTLMESGADRNSVIVNIGGGAVCDLGGFVASTFMRGIRHINIPTTLLAMVDAAVGGKTAIDLAGVKNVVGTFHLPAAVCVEPLFLDTLPEIEKMSGTVEMLKTMLVGGAVESIPAGWQDLLTAENIRTCVEIKDAVVRQDVNDHGMRKILNFGHTFGHAVEAYSAMQGNGLPHGYAVGIGMLCATYLSVKKLGLEKSLFNALRGYVSSLFILPEYTLKDAETMLSIMRHDKKNGDGEVRCVLLQSVGAAVIDVAVSEMEIRDALLAYDKSL